MAAEASESWERTEEPSPRRLREARLDGRVARAPLVTTAALALAAAGGLALGGGLLARHLAAFLQAALDPGRPFADPAIAGEAILEGVGAGIAIVLPAGLGALAVAWLSQLWQVGFLWTPRPLRPRAERISPVANLGRLASLRSLRRLATDLVSILVAVAAAIWALGGAGERLARLPELPLVEGAAELARLATRLAGAAGGGLLAVGVVDWALERMRIRGELRTTRREALVERREEEGDPEARRRRLGFARTLPFAPAVVLRRSDLVLVASDRAGVSHAVALAAEDAAPRILLVARGAAAARLAALARRDGVAIAVRNGLARDLSAADPRSGEAAPERFRADLAELLAEVPAVRRRLVPGDAR